MPIPQLWINSPISAYGIPWLAQRDIHIAAAHDDPRAAFSAVEVMGQNFRVGY